MSRRTKLHLELEARAIDISKHARKVWNDSHKVASYAITWPAKAVATDDGKMVSAVMCALPPGQAWNERIQTLSEMATRTNAFGVVLVEERDQLVRVFFETSEEAKYWRMPIRRHGDVVVCGPPITQTNRECLGLVWRPRQLAS